MPTARKLEKSLNQWFCIKTPEYFCEDCHDYFEFVHVHDSVLIWPTKTDPSMLRILGKLQSVGAKVVIYKDEFGPYISYYQLDD